MFRQGSALLLRSNDGAGGLGAVQGPPQLPPMWSVGDQPSFGAGWPWWMEGPQKVTWSCHQVIFQDITEPGRDGAEGHGGDRGWGSEWLLVDGFVPGLCSELGNSSLSLQFGERISDPAIWGTLSLQFGAHVRLRPHTAPHQTLRFQRAASQKLSSILRDLQQPLSSSRIPLKHPPAPNPLQAGPCAAAQRICASAGTPPQPPPAPGHAASPAALPVTRFITFTWGLKSNQSVRLPQPCKAFFFFFCAVAVCNRHVVCFFFFFPFLDGAKAGFTAIVSRVWSRDGWRWERQQNLHRPSSKAKGRVVFPFLRRAGVGESSRGESLQSPHVAASGAVPAWAGALQVAQEPGKRKCQRCARCELRIEI